MTKAFTHLTLLIVLTAFLSSCQSIRPGDFSILHAPDFTEAEEVPEEVEETSQADDLRAQYMAGVELLEPRILLISEELGYTYEPEYTEDTENEALEPSSASGEEFTPLSMEEAVEAILAPSEVVPEPMETPAEVPQEKPNNHQLPDPSTVVRLGSNWELPMWFCYTTAGLFLASLFSICYIAKQRKEACWRKFRD